MCFDIRPAFHMSMHCSPMSLFDQSFVQLVIAINVVTFAGSYGGTDLIFRIVLQISAFVLQLPHQHNLRRNATCPWFGYAFTCVVESALLQDTLMQT